MSRRPQKLSRWRFLLGDGQTGDSQVSAYGGYLRQLYMASKDAESRDPDYPRCHAEYQQALEKPAEVVGEA